MIVMLRYFPIVEDKIYLTMTGWYMFLLWPGFQHKWYGTWSDQRICLWYWSSANIEEFEVHVHNVFTYLHIPPQECYTLENPISVLWHPWTPQFQFYEIRNNAIASLILIAQHKELIINHLKATAVKSLTTRQNSKHKTYIVNLKYYCSVKKDSNDDKSSYCSKRNIFMYSIHRSAVTATENEKYQCST